MNTPEVKGNRNEQKTKLKAKYATLTDVVLRYEQGKKDEILTKIQTKLGKTKEEMQKIIATLYSFAFSKEYRLVKLSLKCTFSLFFKK